MISGKYELSKKDIQNWVRTVALIYSPVIIQALGQLQTNGAIDYTIAYTGAVTITIDLIRRYLKDYKTEVIKSIDNTSIEEIEKVFSK